MNKDTVLIAASVAALLVFSAATFLCSKRRRHGQSPSQRRDDVELGLDHGGTAAPGLDDAALAAYPTLLYSSSSEKEKDEEEATARDGDGGETAAAAGGSASGSGSWSGSDAARCAVCLADYADGDELRRLPGCRHVFHRGCVDQWLRRRPTCPVCRAPPPPQAAAKGAAGSPAVEVAGSS
jgi:hypothetical protein